MKAKKNKASLTERKPDMTRGKQGNKEKMDLSGYPVYPDGEDIYSKYRKEKDINPEDVSKLKEPHLRDLKNTAKDILDDVTGDDLDIPGAELDDDQETIGSEDEENNYYSLGGDDHEELEEDKGD
jgi:hypothetical protein